MSGTPKPLRGLQEPRAFQTALRDRGAADFTRGISECPFKNAKMKDDWLAGWTEQQAAEKKETPDE